MSEDIRFCIVSPAWNCARWVAKSLQSIQRQTYTNFRCILIDDVSDDDTFSIAQDTVAGDARFTIRRNTQRAFPLANIVAGTNEITSNAQDVIVIVDADDWLMHDDVLKTLSKIYADPSVWLTYGSCELLRPPTLKARLKKFLRQQPCRGQAAPYPAFTRERNLYRFHPGKFLATHLRSYRQFLWANLKDQDLRNEHGHYFPAAADVATMWPMMEMATDEHILYLRDMLYVYNNDYGLSEHQQADNWTESNQYKTNITLRSMPPYLPLKHTS